MTVTTASLDTAIVNAALWLREQVGYKRLASLSLTFAEEPITVTYTAGTGATVTVDDGDPVELADADLEAERWVAA